MSSLTISITAWRYTSATLHFIAIGATVFRLKHRYNLRRLWWDDYWAMFALIVDLTYFTSIWMRREAGDPLLTESLGVRVFWMTAILFPSVIWSARMSIAFSIIRLVPERAKLRYLLFAVVVLFGCSWAALMLQKIWVCARTDHWKVPPTYQCFLGDAVGIITLATDVVADASLIIIPLMLLREIRISRSQRRLLLAIFSSSLFSSFAGVVYAVFVFQADSFPKKKRNILLSLTANVKATTTLLVCNLLVIVTYFYRTFRRGVDLETEPPPPTTKDFPMSNATSARPPNTVTSSLNDFPTVETTSTFDNTPKDRVKPQVQQTVQSSKFVATGGTTALPTISEVDSRYDPLSPSVFVRPPSVASSKVMPNPHHRNSQ